MSKDTDRLIKALRKQGFKVERTQRGHWLVRNADDDVVATLVGTASDRRSWLNDLSALKRAGFIWPPRR